MDWNARYVEGNTPWEKGYPAPPLEEIWGRLERCVKKRGLVLVPGCGLGHDARWLAEKGLQVRGIDIAPLAVESARALTEGRNPSFELKDFFEAEAGSVSLLFEHTCFCAISPNERAAYVRAAKGWLVDGGLLVAIFFLNPMNGGDGPPFGVTREELDEFFKADFELLEEWVPQAAYPEREGRELVRILRKIS